MNARERRAIEWDCTRLIHLYARLTDAARWLELAALYDEGGRMTRPTAPGKFIVGRPAILAAFEARARRTSRHICANVLIEVADERTAYGTSAMLLFTAADMPPLIGGFEDQFILTGDGWQFAERKGTLTF